MITGALYDRLKFLSQILLPAVGTLYFALAGLWGLPDANSVVGTIVAFDAFLGVLLGVSQAQYKKDVYDDGVMKVITNSEGAKIYSLEMGESPEALEDKKEVRFRVDKSPQ